MFDTHCHIQFKAYKDQPDDLNNVIKRCEERGMYLNIVGTQKKTSKAAIELAEKHERFYASVGLHPIQTYDIHVNEETTNFHALAEAFDEAHYDELAQHPKVIAIGETGMDRYHIPKDRTADIIMRDQKDVFLAHYRLAEKYNKALVIHVRDAHDDMLSTLRELPKPVRGTIHCFSGNWEQAEEYLSFGLYLGFTGVITMPPKKSDPEAQAALLDVVKRMPFGRMIIETDAPFLAPVAYRGKRNEPYMIEEVVKEIANVRGISFEDVEQQTTENAKRLFGV